MKQRHRVLLLLFLLSIITYLDRVCLSVAGPRMQADLGISTERWGWVVGAFTISYALFEIPTGVMGDRLGSRLVLTRIVVWWSAFTTLTGAVSNFYALLATRFFFGAGEAGAYPNSSGTIARWFPLSERGQAHGVVWMASRVGGALSPLLVVPIQRAFGWRASFWAFGVIGIVWAVVWYRVYRDRPSDAAGITRAELEEIGPDTSGHAHQSLPWALALRRWNFWKILLMYHLYCWGSYFYVSWLHTYLQKGRGFSEGEMAVYSTLPFIAGIGGNLFGGWVSDRLVMHRGLRFGRRVVGASGLVLSGALMLVAAMSNSKWVALACLTLGYGAMDCMLPVSWSICLDIGRRYAATVGGTMNMAGQLGSFLSSVAFGYAVTYFGSYNAPLYPMALCLVASAVLFTRIDPEEPLIA